MVARRTTTATCVFCGAQIEENDRLVVLEHDDERETSLAREPELTEREHALLVHARCTQPRAASSSLGRFLDARRQ
jgi:hypothetical protein